MPRPKSDIVIPLATIGVLLAIGVPSLQRGDILVGRGCIGGAIVVALWLGIAFLRSRL
jgi:hypothetical protein